MAITPFTPARFKRRIFSQLWILALQFITGMILNFIGHERPGFYHVVYIITLIIHVLTAIGLVEGGFFVAVKERSQLGWWTAIALSITLVFGVLFVFTWMDIFSFLMALGFIGSAWLNVMLYTQAEDRVILSGRPAEHPSRKR